MIVPQISIITVVFNGKNFIRPTIESVISQDFKDLEYIIIDGNSKDGTIDLINSFQKDYPFKLLSEGDQGVYDAMNKGLFMAKGKYVLFLNAGDELTTSHTLSDIFGGKDDSDILYGETNILNNDRQIIGTRSELTSRKLPLQLSKNDFLKGQVVSHQSFIARRSLCEPYNLNYKCSADIDWMLQIISQSKQIVNVNQPVSNYLQGGISDTQLGRCWSERFSILLKYFGFTSTLISHLRFSIRFLRWGRYKTD